MLNTVEKEQATKFCTVIKLDEKKMQGRYAPSLTKFCTVIKLDEKKIQGRYAPFPKQIFVVIRMLTSDPFAVANLLVSFSIRIRIMCLPIADNNKVKVSKI